MTVAELRASEEFLDEIERRGLSLAEAREELSFRILCGELHTILPDETWDSFFGRLWEEFSRKEGTNDGCSK